MFRVTRSLWFLLTVVFLTACEKVNSPTGQRSTPKILVWHAEVEPKNLDWTFVDDKTTFQHAYIFMRGLTRLAVKNDREEASNDLAESFSSPSAGRILIHLKPGVRWSDGTPLEARHFLFAWKRLLSRTPLHPNARSLFVLANAKAFSERHVEFESVGARALDSETLELKLSDTGSDLSTVFSHPSTWPIRSPEPTNATPITLGAFHLEKWQRGVEMRYARSSDRFIGPDGIRILFGVPEELSLSLLINGEVDLLDNAPLDRIPLPNTSLVSVVPLPMAYVLWINPNRRPFLAKTTRRALAESLDVSELARLSSRRLIEVPSLFARGQKAGPAMAFNPLKAKAIFASETSTRPPRLSLSYRADLLSPDISQNLQAQWMKNADFPVDLSPEPNTPEGKGTLESRALSVFSVSLDPFSRRANVIGFLNEVEPTLSQSIWAQIAPIKASLERETAPLGWEGQLSKLERLLIQDEALFVPLGLATKTALTSHRLHGLVHNSVEIWDFQDTTLD